MYTRIKFCGITNKEDLHAAAALGVDAVGLVFHPASSRAITVQQAREILNQPPLFVSLVGLFLNEDPIFVRNVLQTVKLDVLQFHGEETAEYCEAFKMPYVKSVSMAHPPDVELLEKQYQTAAGFVLDSHIPGGQGGTGKTFDWHNANLQFSKPVILAGGLSAENVAQSIKLLTPFAVDVSSGIEVTKGKKELNKMTAFVEAVRGTCGG